jgi:hypothetical protein
MLPASSEQRGHAGFHPFVLGRRRSVVVNKPESAGRAEFHADGMTVAQIAQDLDRG